MTTYKREVGVKFRNLRILVTAVTGLILSLGSAVTAAPVRLELPLRFEEFEPQKGTVGLNVLRNDIANLVLERTVYSSEQMLHREAITVDYQHGLPRVIEIPIEFDGIRDLSDGIYTIMLEARGDISGESQAAQLATLVLDVQVDHGNLRPISQVEYSRWPDAADEEQVADRGSRSSIDETVVGAISTEALFGRPNLRNEGITHRAYCGTDNRCSVVFYNQICNRGTNTAYSFAVGMKGWGMPTITSCTGTWRALNTSSSLAPNSCRSVLQYGPGYVGPRILKGTYLTVTGYADIHCQVPESYESDNARIQSIRVGY